MMKMKRCWQLVGLGVVAGWGGAGPLASFGADGADRGAAVYQAQCASCHGATGEGSAAYNKPLVGDRSIGQLAHLIERTMPEDDPGSCAGAEAQAVARFIHGAFYSVTARERNRPARVELARLTVRQYRNSLADLVGSFRSRVDWHGGSGLKGHYYKARDFWNKKDLVLERVDPEVRFDFGVEAPDPKGFDRAQFSIRWDGAVLAPETGEYDFVVSSDQGISLYVNDDKHTLIDAQVASGAQTEQRGSIFLVGGRSYPIRLVFTKAKQGVDDSKGKKLPDKHSGIRLAWRPPGGVEATIPTRFLSPDWVAESFACSTPFPPDDRSVGFERGSTVSRAWDLATTDAAVEFVAYVMAHLRDLGAGSEDDAKRPANLQSIARKTAEAAFRHPLTPEQVERYVAEPFRSAPNPDSALRRSLLRVVKSPHFLYREVECRDPYQVASRLSYELWDAPPDGPLLDAAKHNKLQRHDDLVAQANRMLGDVRARAKVREFLLGWLRVDPAPDLGKDPALFPGFDPALVDDARTSLELTLDSIVWGDNPDFRRLLRDETTFLNGRLAEFYGFPGLATDAPFRAVAWQGDERAGVLTHPYLMARFAYSGASSPIHRGVFLMRSVLGRSLRPPPEAVAPLAPDLHAGLTTRQRVELQTSPTSCVNCHSQINPLGFGLERFDAVGRLRAEEKGKPVDATGIYEGPDGSSQPYQGARELAQILAESPEAHAAFVTQLFHHLVKQPIRAFGPTTRADLTASFAGHHYNIRHLIAEIAATSAQPIKAPDEVWPRDLFR